MMIKKLITIFSRKEVFKPITKSLVSSFPEIFFQELDEPQNHNIDSVYVFTLHKCASTMQDRIFTEIAKYNGISKVSIDLFCFRNNYRLTKSNIADLKKIIVPKGYLYGVYRQLGFGQKPEFNHFDIKKKKSILVVRDPRDILTSHYFSQYFSHRKPGAIEKLISEDLIEMNIDEFVLSQMHNFKHRFERYINYLLPTMKCKVFRYEDIIYDIENFINSSVNHLNLEFCGKQARILAKNEMRIPDHEDKFQHIRKAIPGDHKEKLKPTTIKTLNEYFADILSIFKYN
jgi:hypothetical protein